MRIQLWSYNYEPEPTGIGPVSRAWAQAMRQAGHEIEVIAAHPHYPEPNWGSRRLPYRERRDGVKVTRLPLWIGRASAKERLRQEASFAAWQTAWLPLLGGAEAVVAVSPCFPALAPAILNRKLRRKPLILWIQDILPDGAVSTGILDEGVAIRASRRLEMAAYSAADQIVVISDRFAENLLSKGVPPEKINRIYNPATRPLSRDSQRSPGGDTAPRVLAMGNIGHSQGLDQVVRAFENSSELERLGARLIITGTGVAEDDVRAAITTDRVEMLGLVSDDRLEQELARASIGLVSQRSDFPEFNMPSKLMNFLAAGLPVVASVGSDSEVAMVAEQSGAGVVFASDRVERLGSAIAGVLSDSIRLNELAEAASDFASRNLRPESHAARFTEVLSRADQPPRTSSASAWSSRPPE